MGEAKFMVDYTGSGKLMDVFHPTLPMSYVQGFIDVPPLTPSTNQNTLGFAHWDFNVPIPNPFLFVTEFRTRGSSPHLCGADTYFTHLGGTTWRLNVVGRLVVSTFGGFPNNDPQWRTPLMNDVGEIKIYYGGYRG